MMAQGNMRDLQISIPFLHPRFYRFPNHFIMKPDSWNWDLCIALFLVHICLSTTYPHTHTHTLSGSILILCLHTPVIIVCTLCPLHTPSITHRHERERVLDGQLAKVNDLQSTLTCREAFFIKMTLKFSRIQPRITLTKLEDIGQQWNRTESLSKASTNKPL